MALNTLQNFYKATVTRDWAIGTGNRYVDVLPTPSAGRLVVNGSNSTKREIVEYSGKGTDGSGNYITLTTRGVGGTTEQTHDVNESVRMNITAEDYADIQTEIDAVNSDVSTLDGEVVKKTGDQTITSGVKTFVESPIVPTPTTDYQASTKKYADDLTFAGAPDASTTSKGIVEIATSSEVTAGTDTGGTGAPLVVQPSQLASVSSVSIEAGEDLTAGDAVFISGGQGGALLSATSTTNTTIDTTNGWWYQSYTTDSNAVAIKAVTLRLSGTGTWTVTIRSSPTGSNLISPVSYGPNNVGTDSGDITFVFPTAVAVTASTTYYIVITGPGLRGGTTSSYSGGVSGTSSTSGASWSTPATTVTGDFYFKAYEVVIDTGTVGKTSANSALFYGSDYTTNFIGFSTNTVSKGGTAIIRTINQFTGLSGLTAGTLYYLSNTPGAIASSAGTVSKKIGTALSSTSLLIKHDN